jgi:hypothetical protein
MKLNNGAEIIEQRGEVVLARWNSPHPFVTWRVDDEGNAYWGHYFKTELEARYSFERRSETP